MPTVIRKADGKEFDVNDGHSSLTDDDFTVKPSKAKKKTVTKRKSGIKKTAEG